MSVFPNILSAQLAGGVGTEGRCPQISCCDLKQLCAGCEWTSKIHSHEIRTTTREDFGATFQTLALDGQYLCRQDQSLRYLWGAC